MASVPAAASVPVLDALPPSVPVAVAVATDSAAESLPAPGSSESIVLAWPVTVALPRVTVETEIPPSPVKAEIRLGAFVAYETPTGSPAVSVGRYAGTPLRAPVMVRLLKATISWSLINQRQDFTVNELQRRKSCLLLLTATSMTIPLQTAVVPSSLISHSVASVRQESVCALFLEEDKM